MNIKVLEIVAYKVRHNDPTNMYLVLRVCMSFILFMLYIFYKYIITQLNCVLLLTRISLSIRTKKKKIEKMMILLVTKKYF